MALSSVSVFKISENTWTENLKKLNVPRKGTSGCHVGGNIFVIGGLTKFKTEVNSIEMSNYTELARGKAVWRLIKPPNNEFSPRAFSVVAPINSEEIAILGRKTSDAEFLSDIFNFNTRTGKFTRTISENPIKFWSPRNATVSLSPNVLTAFVRD